MTKFNYQLNFKEINFREHPELYMIGRGEQGVLLVEPYKSEILPFWRFKTPAIAEQSAKTIYALFLNYLKKDEFVGMDMARKFLQMGYTRSRRYANHPSGRKYAAAERPDITPITVIPPYQSEKNRAHYIVTKTKKILPKAADALTNEKAQCAAIFYKYYAKAKNNAEYKKQKKRHQTLYAAQNKE